MDEMALLKEMGDDTPLSSTTDLTPARNRLMTTIAADEPRVVRRPRRRLVVSAAATVGLAAAITGVVALGGLETVGVAPQEASAAEILHQAADAVRTLPDTPPRPDQFIYTKTEYSQADAAISLRETWLSADGTHDSLISQGGGTTPIPGCRNGQAAVVKGDEPIPGVFEPCTPNPAYRTDLPTDVAGMREYLGQDPDGAPGQQQNVAKLIHFAVAESYVPPASLAALFEAIADFPGLTVEENVQDGAGRTGIGVSWTRDGETTTLVFDRTTHAFLGFEGLEAVTVQAIVDTAGQQP